MSATPSPDKIYAIANAEVGYHEGPNNQNKYADYVGVPNNQAWCTTFSSWCFKKAGFQNLDLMSDYSVDQYDWFHNKGRTSGYPAVGAVVWYGPGGDEHTGWVYAYDADYIYTIEGNWGNQVAKMKRPRREPLNGLDIFQYGYPAFPEGIITADPNHTVQGSTYAAAASVDTSGGSGSTTPPPSDGGSTTPPAASNGLPTVDHNDPSAKPLQRELIRTGYMPADTVLADNYGPITQASVLRFFKDYPQYQDAGNPNDAQIGPQGWAALQALPDNAATSKPPADGGSTPPPDDGGTSTPPDDGGTTTPPPHVSGLTAAQRAAVKTALAAHLDDVVDVIAGALGKAETPPPADDGGDHGHHGGHGHGHNPPPDDGGSTPPPATSGEVTPAALLAALAKLPSTVAGGKYATDDGSSETIEIMKASTGAYWWTADADIDTDGQDFPESDHNSDRQSETSFQQSDGQPLNSGKLPWVVVPLPSGRFNYRDAGIKGGDSAIVIYNGKMVYAVFGDEGPMNIIGEISYAAAKALGVPGIPYSGIDSKDVTYIVFPGSTVRPIESLDAVNAQGLANAQALIAAAQN